MSSVVELTAAGGLRLRLDADGSLRVAWGEPDWFGPGRLTGCYAGTAFTGVAEMSAAPGVHHGHDDLGAFRALAWSWSGTPFALRTAARAYADHPVLVLRLEAPDGFENAGSGTFAEPLVAWPHFVPSARAAGGVAEGTVSYAHQWAEFALPVFGDANATNFLFAPHRPPVVQPLMLIAPDGRTILLAPLDHFHEQIIAVRADAEAGALRCGWQGDLAVAPRGFATELAVWTGVGPRAALTAWIGWLRARHATERPSRYADTGLARLSYWTDNGAYYYYRTEPEADYTETLTRAVADCEARGIPIAMVQLDSWFYPHEHLRSVSAEGAPLVPPSGAMTWEPRADLFPDGFAELRRRLEHRPLAFHARHFSARSPYFEREPAWTDGEYAHPQNENLLRRLLGSAASWGAVTYEQDWMVESFLGVRGLRAAPGRARAWQEALDRAAADNGLTLQWCMATPADFLQTVTLRRLTSIRTSGDYRYLFDNGLNWVWFFHTNALARALGVPAFKDVFLSDRESEPYAEIEALLAALSTGPVSIGDRIGRADRDLVLRTCREDGVLIKPDEPVAALDHCFRTHTYRDARLLLGETYSTHPAGRWLYVVTLHASRERAPIVEGVALEQLGGLRPSGPVLAYNWRTGNWTRLERDAAWEVRLEWQDWDYRVFCPLLPGERTVFGDVGKYATVGDRRISGITAMADRICFDVLGSMSTLVEVHGYSPTPPVTASVDQRTIPRDGEQSIAGESFRWTQDGRWIVRAATGRGDAAQVRIEW